jgi:hypothetical protein
MDAMGILAEAAKQHGGNPGAGSHMQLQGEDVVFTADQQQPDNHFDETPSPWEPGDPLEQEILEPDRKAVYVCSKCHHEECYGPKHHSECGPCVTQNYECRDLEDALTCPLRNSNPTKWKLKHRAYFRVQKEIESKNKRAEKQLKKTRIAAENAQKKEDAKQSQRKLISVRRILIIQIHTRRQINKCRS